MKGKDKEAQVRAAKRQLATVSDYKQLFRSPIGQKVLLDLVATHNVMAPIFNKDHSEMAFAEGERNVILRILNYLGTNVTEMLKLIEQSNDEQSRDIFAGLKGEF